VRWSIQRQKDNAWAEYVHGEEGKALKKQTPVKKPDLFQFYRQYPVARNESHSENGYGVIEKIEQGNKLSNTRNR
jgi:hypothetical protein